MDRHALTPPARRRLVAAAAAHGAWVVVLSFLLLQWGWSRPDEVRLVRLTELLRPSVPFADIPPAVGAPGFLFVNVAHELRLVGLVDSLGRAVGDQAVVDRARLAAFLERLGRLGHPQRMVVFDVAFVDPTPDDARFGAALARTPQVLVAQELDKQGRPVPVAVAAATGVAAFPRQGGTVLKFTRVWNDSLASLPDRMAASLDPALYARRARWDWRHPLRLGTALLSYRLCPAGSPRCLSAAGGGARGSLDPVTSHLDLSTLDGLSDDVLCEFVSGRLLIVGDFGGGDVHGTAVGSLPGPFIVANAYLGLVAGDDLVPLGLLVLMWAGFGALSYGVFSGHRPAPASRAWMRAGLRRLGTGPGEAALVRAGARLRSKWALAWIPMSLLGLSLLSGLFFGQHLQVLALTAYFGSVAGLRPGWRRVRALWRRIARAVSRTSPDVPGPDPPTGALPGS